MGQAPKLLDKWLMAACVVLRQHHSSDEGLLEISTVHRENVPVLRQWREEALRAVESYMPTIGKGKAFRIVASLNLYYFLLISKSGRKRS